MRCLITGATGFIGRHLIAPLLNRGDDVVLLVRHSRAVESMAATGARVVLGDITRPETLPAALEGVDVVYHLAGVVKSIQRGDFFHVNETGTRHLLAACAARSTPPTVVSVSSMAAAGPVQGEQPRREEDPLCPVSIYGLSKRGGEQACESFADRLPITIIRPPLVFGEGDPATYRLFQPIMSWGIHIVPGLRPRRVSLIHAEDLAQLMLLAAERGARLPSDAPTGNPAAQGYYFAAGDDRPSYRELGELIGRASGRESTRIIFAPDPIAWSVGLWGELTSQLFRRPAVINLDKIRDILAGSWICSPERAQQQLGFRMALPLNERLRQTTESIRRAAGQVEFNFRSPRAQAT